MSELKEWTASEIEEYDDARLELAQDGKIDCTRVYIKSEADKVIADLEESHKKEVGQLLMEIVELKEERRWRKFPDEKPDGEGDYLVMARYPDDDELHIEICLYDRGCEDFGHYERRYAGSGNSFGGFDDEELVTHNVSFWLPMPSAPKE